MKTWAERIKDLEATLLAKREQMAQIMQKALDEGRSTDEAEGEQVDGLRAECKQLVVDIERAKECESLGVQGARTIEPAPAGTDPAKAATQQRGATGPTIIVRSSKDAEDKFQGQSYVRMVIAKALAHMQGIGGQAPAEIAAARWGKTNPTLVNVIKAGVAGGGSGSGEWAAELVQADTRYTGDFIEYLYGKTLFDRLPLRQVPAHVTIKGQDGAASGYWVGESQGIPVTTADFSSVNLTPLKVGAIAVVSNELMRDSSPAAEMLVRDALVQASAQRVDTTFLSTSAASAGVSPAGILNGLPGFNSHGATAEAVIADFKQLTAIFQSYKNASDLVVVTTPDLAVSLGLMLTALGQQQFPGVGQDGGTLLGRPVFTGDNVGAGHFIMLKPSDIYRIGDSGVQVSISNVATIEQDSAPQGASDTPTAASATLMSMYQTESTAIKVVRSVNFAKRRSHAVQYIDNADYGATDTAA
ncbi:MAG TPA: phage major capsid protein [Rubrivivax sp.]|nr:phage major capsid protein [Rubrivivax sp.]